MFTFCRDPWGKKRGKTRLEGKKRGKTRLQGSAAAGTDEILFRLVPGNGAQFGAQAPTKTDVQTGAGARASSLNRV